jgi:hypothetical protein
MQLSIYSDQGKALYCLHGIKIQLGAVGPIGLRPALHIASY